MGIGITIAVYERENRFVKSLSEYLNERYGSYFTVYAFDDAGRLLQFVQENKCSLCLAGKGSLDGFQTEKLLGLVGKLLYFVQSREEEGIYLYQSMEVIGREIFEIFTEEFSQESGAGENLKRHRQMKVIGFYSPVRSILQSSLALTMGELLAKEQKVLYLNFEPYSGFEFLMQKHFTHDLSDLLFYLKEDTSKFRCRLKSIAEQVGNLYYIPPVFAYPDLEDVDAGLWQKLIQAILTQTEYDLLILDLTEQISGLFHLLLLCDEIYTCHEENELAGAKMQQYEEMLSYLQKQEILQKTRTFRIPSFQNVPRQASLFTHGEMAEFVGKMLSEKEECNCDGGRAEKYPAGNQGEAV